MPLDDLAESPERDALAVRKTVALTPGNRVGLPVDDLKELVDESRLSDPGDPHEGHELGRALLTDAREERDEDLELEAQADERSALTALGEVDTERRRWLERFPDRNRLGLTFRDDRLRLEIGNNPLGCTVCSLVDEHAVDRRGRFQTGGHVDDITRRHPLSRFGPRIERNERLTRRDAQPNLELTLPDDRVPNREPGRTARSGSSSCDTGAPKSAITASPMNFSTVPPERSSSVRSRSVVRRQQCMDVFWIHPFSPGCKADQVAEKYADDLPLLTPRGRHNCERPATCVAEPGGLRVWLSAAGTSLHMGRVRPPVRSPDSCRLVVRHPCHPTTPPVGDHSSSSLLTPASTTSTQSSRILCPSWTRPRCQQHSPARARWPRSELEGSQFGRHGASARTPWTGQDRSSRRHCGRDAAAATAPPILAVANLDVRSHVSGSDLLAGVGNGRSERSTRLHCEAGPTTRPRRAVRLDRPRVPVPDASSRTPKWWSSRPAA